MSKNSQKLAEVFTVWTDEIEQRLDAVFYRPEIRALLQNLDKLKTFPLGDLILEMSGGATPKVTEDFYLEEGGIPFLRVQNITEEGINLEDVKYIKTEVHETLLKRSQLKKNDLVFTITGRIGSVAVIPDNFEGNINQHSVRFHLKEEINGITISPYYVAVFFNTEVGRQISLRKITGGTRPALDYEALKSLPVPLPSFDIQNQVLRKTQEAYKQKKSKEAEILRILSSINDFVLSELNIDIPERKEKKIFQIWSDEIEGRIDPSYFRPIFKMLDKKISTTKYNVKTLKNLSTKITSGATPLSGGDAYTDQDTGIPFVRSGNINPDNKINFNSLLYVKPEIHNKKLKSSRLKRGDLMVAIVGATIGQVSVYENDHEANINQAIALIRLDEQVNSEYAKEFLYSKIGQIQLDRIKRPVARANINLNEVGSLQIIYPSKNKQNEMVIKIRKIREKARNLRHEAESVVIEAEKEVEQMIFA